MTMNPMAREFCKDIIAHTGDDALRLIFADWLAENGQEELGAFIKAQIETGTDLRVPASSPGPPVSKYQAEDGFATVTLLHDGFQGVTRTYRRGFIHTVSCWFEDWQRYGPRLCNAHPVSRYEMMDGRPSHASTYCWRVVPDATRPPRYRPDVDMSNWVPRYMAVLMTGWLGEDDATKGPLIASHLRRDDYSGGIHLAYRTEHEALSAVSDGAICWARDAP